MLNISCVIFAGGKSSRMGEDKALLPFGGFNTLAEFQFSRLSKMFKHVYISCKDKGKFDFKADFIEDIISDSLHAPTIGFISTYKKLDDELFFVISVDAPFIGESEIKKIIEADSSDVDATIARTESTLHPMCGIYHRSLEKEFSDMLKNDNHKLMFLLKNSKTTYVDFEDDTPFLNLNHPHEYEKALSLISKK